MQQRGPWRDPAGPFGLPARCRDETELVCEIVHFVMPAMGRSARRGAKCSRSRRALELRATGARLLPVKDEDFILIPRLAATAQCSCVFIGERFSISRDGNTPSGADATLRDVFFHGAARQIVIELA
jgi:hypothetical protein